MKNVYIAIVIVAVVVVAVLSAVFLRGRFSKSGQGTQVPEATTQEEEVGAEPTPVEPVATSEALPEEGVGGEPVPAEIASPMPEVVPIPGSAGEPVPVPPKVAP